uniref:phosphatidate phosphatase n=1 Tax=Neogobius melanostomus TaxID=47308 RepID=A0A8C6SFY2_9GOBI
MNYVGQLAGQVFVQVKELYRGLNPATLSGCIDVIVVRQPDGSLQCSPFHVRFGKMGVLRSREKVVDIEINGEPVSLQMKLGENGEAFFVMETESTLVNTILCSSLPVQNLGQSDGGMSKKRRKRRRKAQADGGGRRDESEREFSEDEDMFTIDLSSDEDIESDCTRYKSVLYTDHGQSVIMLHCCLHSSRGTPETAKTGGDNEALQGSMQGLHSANLMIKVFVVCHTHRPELNICLGIAVGRAVESIGLSPAAMETCSLTPRNFSDHLDRVGVRGSPIRRTDSPSKKKDKRSQHLGTDGIYLDDITELEPEVAALYFPKSNSVKLDSEMMMCVRSENHSPESVGSSGMDSGLDSLPDHFGDLPHVAISLCGGLTDNRAITRVQFQQRAVSYQQFSENPSIIDDPNLVVKIGNKYYNWNTAAPVMLAMQVYQKPLPQASVENIMKEKMPKKGGRWWFSWRGKNSDSKSVCSICVSMMLEFMVLLFRDSSSDEDHRSSTFVSGSLPEPLDTSASVCYKKTLRLTSEQLTSLQLKEGPNDVVFSVTTQYQGTCRCNGTIYLWSWDDKIVISDIDGTITRSDTLGHILPTLGKDWTHQGIAQLYHKVSQNGYKFMYCSARAIGMADMTRGYLNWVNERGTMLPIGPVLLSPSSLFSALHREVIEKKPEKFKIECLTDIKNLFYPNTESFYAAFGNRATDVYSYKEVGVPLNRIFTVNPKGELTQEHTKTNISSFGHLTEMVDNVFPLLVQEGGSEVSDKFSQSNYWSKQIDGMNAEEADDDLQTVETS